MILDFNLINPPNYAVVYQNNFFYDRLVLSKGELVFMKKTASCELEKQLFESVEDRTPDYVKNRNLMDFSNKGEFTFTLKKEHLMPYDAQTNPEGLNLKEWFANYAKEAKVSTAGIRGPQNILYQIGRAHV